MPIIRIIKDGVFIEEDKCCNVDDTPEVSDEIAKLFYKRNWAVPHFESDDLQVQETESENEEQEEQVDLSAGTDLSKGRGRK
jgi:hypothetical protein